MRSRDMKILAATIFLAFAGLGLMASIRAEAAVVAPAKDGAIGAVEPMITYVRRSGGSSGGARAPSSGGRSFSSGGRSIRSGGSAIRSGRSTFRSGPARSFRPRPAVRTNRAIVNRRGSRPPVFRRWHPRHLAHRKWHRRPYYGYVIGGVTIGAILAASAYYVYADAPPADGLCWYWIDPSETRGYWDYCDDPPY